jgi:hypothetical protein
MCDAKLRPFRPLNDTEIECGLTDRSHTHHKATLKNYAYEGSQTEIQWAESDRRNFRGTWAPCLDSRCFLPLQHRGTHAT